MTTMNIKDPDVHGLARALAERRHTSLTNAVRQALSEALERDQEAREDYVDRVLAVARRAHAEMDRLGIEPLTDDDIYDENGVPR
jgi:antitoxin VapB